jgi:glycerol-3-phosphate acyltransferase PlsY
MMLPITLLGSYAIGCFVSAYYLVRIFAGADVRRLGSGTAGARNTMRSHGRALGIAVLVLDAAKGALAVAVAQRFAGTQWAEHLALACVIAGHVWPAQLQFRGGKGAASFAGGLLRADWRVALIAFAIGLVFLAATRRFTRSGLTALVLVPPLILASGSDVSVAVASIAPIALVLLAHRPQVARPLPEVSP